MATPCLKASSGDAVLAGEQPACSYSRCIFAPEAWSASQGLVCEHLPPGLVNKACP